MTEVDEVVLSLSVRGLATGDISAHFAQIYGASVSKETISRITDKVVEEIVGWQNRFLDAGPRRGLHRRDVEGMVKVRDGRVANRPVYATIGVTLAGDKDVLGSWSAPVSEGAKL